MVSRETLKGSSSEQIWVEGEFDYDGVDQGLPGGSVVKHPPSAGDTVLIPGLGRSPGEGNGTPL